MDTKRRSLGVVFAAIIILSCTLASTSALILDKSVKVGESGFTITVMGTNEEDASRFQSKLMQDNGGEYELWVTKTVWDPVTNTWVKEIAAQVGNTITFQINVTGKNVSKICAEKLLFLNISDSLPGNCRLETDPAISDYYDEVSDVFYINITVPCVIEACGEGVNKVWVDTYCINLSTNESTFVYGINDSATVNVDCPVPAFTPGGLITLVSLLATIAVLSVRRKRH
ncbi:MAG: hypothetical protein ACP5E9_02800 [Candidatus Methanospirareceae archaeon]